MTYFVHLPKLDSKLYTDYLLNEFIPSQNFEEELQHRYIQYFRKEFIKDRMILRLEHTLKTLYKFPPIEYFSIFKHTANQPIHSDGMTIPRYTSLNLPLCGYESTKMLFYKNISSVTPDIKDANYYLPSEVELISELDGTNDWVLVNSSVPHQIVNINPEFPRYTLCVRFFANPTIGFLIDRMNGPA